MLIGITGQARAGKDTIGDHLIRQHKFQRLSFAAPLKAAAYEMTKCWDNFDLYGDNKEVVHEDIGVSPREFLQKLGTEFGRSINKDLWLMVAETTYAAMPEENVVITDVRFENEAQWVRSMGGVIWHVERPMIGIPSVREHSSESGIEPGAGDVLLRNNSSIAALQGIVDMELAINQKC